MRAEPVLVVGSVALDTVETPTERREEVLGGSATYFAYAASFFAPVRLVGVVGEDFPPRYREVLAERDIDLAGLLTRPGRTFRWVGRYLQDLNQRRTLDIQLNVFGEYPPEVPPSFRGSRYLFLANCRPAVQQAVLEEVERPRLAVADTINHWIQSARGELVDLLGRVDGVLLNDEEVRMLSGRTDLVRAAVEVLRLGPRFVVVKKGEHGVLVVEGSEAGVRLTALPAVPLEGVRDPTGAGDCFAGGFMGYLAATGGEDIRGAAARGVVLASFCVEDFSLDRLRRTSPREIDRRLADYRRMLAI